MNKNRPFLGKRRMGGSHIKRALQGGEILALQLWGCNNINDKGSAT
uniref:Uncharacterized protein n=1 Tax=Arundo donax TaxID=35708 RepID=A0A0A9EC44_ARUDO